jgi:hypothetical protein
MSRYLVVLIWPVGMALIFGIAALVSRGRRFAPAQDAGGRDAGRRHSRRRTPDSAFGAAVRDTGQLVLVAVVGVAAVFALMSLLGLGVVYHGLTIDKPIFTFVSGHQVHAVAAAMKRLTKIGDTWTVWGAAVAAAVCLAVSSRSRRWLPPVALAALIVADHYTTLALRHEFHRLGPPTSPLGTYPSGGCDRCIVFFGLIAYLLWREFSGRRETAVWAGAAVAALGFNEAYSRVYLSLHWFTDSLSGLLYGGLLLLAFITAIRVVAGRAVTAPRSAEAVASGLPVQISPAAGSVA